MSLPSRVKNFFSILKTKLWFPIWRQSHRIATKMPSKNQWRQFFKILTKKERVTFLVFLTLAASSLIFLSTNFYFKNTEIKPAFGGNYIEGLVGQPRFINPIYAASSDVDRDLSELIFSGLMKHNEKGGVIPNLAKECNSLEEGKIFEVYLRENVFWHDGNQLTADDVIFTIQTIQNPDYKSPLRADWLGVEVERISDFGIRFKLKDPYSAFLERLTLKILPKHIWQDIPPSNFPLAIYNLQPIGSGPYKFKKLSKDELGYIESLTLIANLNYFKGRPKIAEISFRFFDTEEDLIKAASKGEIKGLTVVSLKKYNQEIEVSEKILPDLLKGNIFCDYHLSLPRYFAVFFNPNKSEILAKKEIRQALNYGTNKNEILEKALVSQGKIVNSPILPEFYSFEFPSEIYKFNLEKAEESLEKAGFIKNEEGLRVKIIEKEPAFQFKSNLNVGSRGEEVEKLQECLAKYPEIYPEGEITGYFGEKTKEAVIKFKEKYVEDVTSTSLVGRKTRAKLNEFCLEPAEEVLGLSFSLITVDQPLLIEVANLLKNQWKVLGIEVKIKTFDILTLEQEVIKPRDYELLLFGEVLGTIPDPFPFWHSSQKKDPGLNLAGYENKNCDKLLEEARQTLDENERRESLEKFQDYLIEDAPAIFLYNPDYLFLVSKEIKGIETKTIVDPSKRFSNVENWYLKTKRTWW